MKQLNPSKHHALSKLQSQDQLSQYFLGHLSVNRILENYQYLDGRMQKQIGAINYNDLIFD